MRSWACVTLGPDLELRSTPTVVSLQPGRASLAAPRRARPRAVRRAGRNSRPLGGGAAAGPRRVTAGPTRSGSRRSARAAQSALLGAQADGAGRHRALLQAGGARPKRRSERGGVALLRRPVRVARDGSPGAFAAGRRRARLGTARRPQRLAAGAFTRARRHAESLSSRGGRTARTVSMSRCRSSTPRGSTRPPGPDRCNSELSFLEWPGATSRSRARFARATGRALRSRRAPPPSLSGSMQPSPGHSAPAVAFRSAAEISGDDRARTGDRSAPWCRRKRAARAPAADDSGTSLLLSPAPRTRAVACSAADLISSARASAQKSLVAPGCC